MAAVEKPMPRITAINAPYFEAAAEGHFQLQQCSHCHQYVYYPRVACPQCLANNGLVWKEVSGRGFIYSFALIHRPQHPAFFEDVPIPLAAIQLEEGPTVISTIVNCPTDMIYIGMPVQVTTFRVSPGIGLSKFEPVLAK